MEVLKVLTHIMKKTILLMDLTMILELHYIQLASLANFKQLLGWFKKELI